MYTVFYDFNFNHYILPYILGLGRYSHYCYTIDTKNRAIPIDAVIKLPTETDDGDSRKKNDYSETKTIRSTIEFHEIKQTLKHIEFDFNYVELILF